MVFRKPYAFLIKHFKLLHLILAVIIAYLLDATKNLLDFISEYLSNTSVLYYRDYASKLFSNWMFILPIFMIIILLILLVVLFKKKKPTFFYIINIVIAAGLIVIYNVSMRTVIRMETEILSNQSVSLVRDFLLLLLIAQIFSLIITLIRGIGFDIKKFDFGKDLQELEIDTEDNEEVEISIDVDTNKINRHIRKRKRFIKYNYIEHQLLYNILFVIIGISVIGTTMYFVFKEDTYYGMNETFYTDDFAITLTNAFVTNQDYKGNVLSDDNYFVLVEAYIYSITGEVNVLDSRSIQLEIGSTVIYHNGKLSSSFFDLGEVYIEKKIEGEQIPVLFLFEIPKEFINKKMIFRYAENFGTISGRLNPEIIDINLDVLNLDDTVKVNNMEFNNEIVVENTLFQETTINIKELNISDKFKISYRKKISDNEYYDSTEYLTPNIDENYDKSLLNIKGTIDINSYEYGIVSFYRFIEAFGRIVYKVNNETKIYNFSNNEIKSDKINQVNTYYLEIKKEILESEEIYFQIRLRNNIYQYKIR